jgi:hypothetical protein
MTITVNTKAYAFDTNPSADQGVHVGPSNTFASKDVLVLGRSAAKPTATYAGNARSSAKFQRTVTLGDGSTAIATAEASFSIPVGMAEADVDSLRDDLGDLLLLQAADDLVWKHDITG